MPDEHPSAHAGAHRPGPHPPGPSRPAAHTSEPATEPTAAQPTPAPALPALSSSDAEPLGNLSLCFRLHGPEDDVIRMIERLSRELPITVCVDAYATLPDVVWDAFPPNFLSKSERDLVREDLRLSTTAEIARTLHLSHKTIHSYRTHIRKQFLGIATAQRPAWMQAWLRRYPGVSASTRAAAQGGQP
ncbi:MAG TPA: hypothetical protein VFS21_38035 [Roseiflexaceae bacterium]|nr:hypothetical protein [Roseiflexaceae bacterium]